MKVKKWKDRVEYKLYSLLLMFMLCCSTLCLPYLVGGRIEGSGGLRNLVLVSKMPREAVLGVFSSWP